jgi:putative ABC transport system substrate-binding protein
LGKKRVDRVQRRSVIAGLAVSLVVPQRPSAQQVSAKIPRVGFLTIGDNERTRILDAFRGGLRDLGYVEGRNIILEFRFAHGDLSRGPQLAAELVTLPTDVIVTEGFPPDVVDPSGHVPIVVPALMDPVQRGFAFSIARPGRNITGFTLMQPSSTGNAWSCCVRRLPILPLSQP